MTFFFVFWKGEERTGNDDFLGFQMFSKTLAYWKLGRYGDYQVLKEQEKFVSFFFFERIVFQCSERYDFDSRIEFKKVLKLIMNIWYSDIFFLWNQFENTWKFEIHRTSSGKVFGTAQRWPRNLPSLYNFEILRCQVNKRNRNVSISKIEMNWLLLIISLISTTNEICSEAIEPATCCKS